MAIHPDPENLWDSDFIKKMMKSFKKELRPMASFSYPAATSSTTSSYGFGYKDTDYDSEKVKEDAEESRKQMKEIREEEKVKEDLRTEPQLFDPKELDLDDNK